MGTCPPCATDHCEEHQGRYSVSIDKKGKKGLKRRDAACECPRCVVRSAPTSATVSRVDPAVANRTREWTEDPCPSQKCGHRSHWVALGPMLDNGQRLPIATDGSCHGCPTCRGEAPAVLVVV